MANQADRFLVRLRKRHPAFGWRLTVIATAAAFVVGIALLRILGFLASVGLVVSGTKEGWELTNISSDDAKDIHFQFSRATVDNEANRIQPLAIEVTRIESLEARETAGLRFNDGFVASAIVRTETVERKRKIGSQGYCLMIFFSHPSEEHQTVYFWEKQ